MQVDVKFFALAADLAGTREASMELPDGTTVGAAWDELVARYPGLARYREELLLAVNRQFASPEKELHAGDVLAIIPPVSGGGHPAPEEGGDHGSGGQCGNAKANYLTGEELDPLSILNQVRHPEAGALVLFVGTVRALTEGNRTLSVTYEAYQQMASEQLRVIEEEMRSRWDLREVRILHRYGHLEPGEDSVVIAVSAPHRGDAFSACRHAIDRIKEMVTIWKKETTTAWSEWVRPTEQR